MNNVNESIHERRSTVSSATHIHCFDVRINRQCFHIPLTDMFPQKEKVDVSTENFRFID